MQKLIAQQRTLPTFGFGSTPEIGGTRGFPLKAVLGHRRIRAPKHLFAANDKLTPVPSADCAECLP